MHASSFFGVYFFFALEAFKQLIFLSLVFEDASLVEMVYLVLLIVGGVGIPCITHRWWSWYTLYYSSLVELVYLVLLIVGGVGIPCITHRWWSW